MCKRNKHPPRPQWTSPTTPSSTLLPPYSNIKAPALGADEFGEHLRTASAIHGGVFQGASVRPDTQTTRIFVHLTMFLYNFNSQEVGDLTQHSALGKEARFPRVDKGEVEIRLPRSTSIWGIREVQQEVHDLQIHKEVTSRSYDMPNVA